MLLTALIIKLFIEANNIIDGIRTNMYEYYGIVNIDPPKTQVFIYLILKIFLQQKLLLDSECSNAISVLASLKGEPINTVMYKAMSYEGFVVKLSMKDGNSYTGTITNMGVPTETSGVDHSLSMMVEMPDEGGNADLKNIHLRQEDISNVVVVSG